MSGRPRFRMVSLCLLLGVSVVALVSCGADRASRPPAPVEPSGISLNPDTTGSGQTPGALASATTLPTIDMRLKTVSSQAARIEYTSTSGITNEHTQVTGAVFVPMGKAPDGGWPVIVYGHPTSGIQSRCAPSLSPVLQGASTVVAALVSAGYVVTVPDYQGLGLDGAHHPYLDAKTVGYNVIDSVRAVRRLLPDVSDRWMAVGVSQGGQAAWAANELAASYGAGLSLVGTVSVSPPTDITGFADLAADGGLTKDQIGPLQMLLASLAAEHPDFNLDDYRRGVAQQKWDVLSACDGPAVADRDKVLADIGPDDLRPSSPAATAALAGYLKQRSLPQSPTAAPALVIYGGMDLLIPVSWTDRALKAACAMGDVIDIRFQRDKGHDDVDISPVYGWMADRFAGVPVASSCNAAATTAAEAPPDGAAGLETGSGEDTNVDQTQSDMEAGG